MAWRFTVHSPGRTTPAPQGRIRRWIGGSHGETGVSHSSIVRSRELDSPISVGSEPNSRIVLADPSCAGAHLELRFAGSHHWQLKMIRGGQVYYRDHEIHEGSEVLLFTADEFRIGECLVSIDGDELESDREWWESLGEEIGPQECRAEGCGRSRITLSAFCRKHHFVQIMHKPCPFE